MVSLHSTKRSPHAFDRRRRLIRSFSLVVFCVFFFFFCSRFGESQKLVRAIFSVAQQYAPSIIFIDECDSFMRKRGAFSEHEANATMRSEFLSLFDGLLSNNSAAASSSGDGAGEVNNSVMVLACTNRPWDLDEAFVRRMPRSFLLPLPSESERIDILTLLLREQSLGHSTAERALLLSQLGALTADYSGSDLKELCRVAAALPVRALLKKHTQENFQQVMHGGVLPSSHAASVSPVHSGKKKKKHHGREGKGSSRKERSKDGVSAAASKAAVESSDEGVISSGEAALAAAGAAAIAAVSSQSSSASSASSSFSTLAPLPAQMDKPRPLQMSDFRTALRAVRPSGTASMRELLAFERKHRGVNDIEQMDGEEEEEEEAEAAAAEGSDSEGKRASEQDEDSDSIYD